MPIITLADWADKAVYKPNKRKFKGFMEPARFSFYSMVKLPIGGEVDESVVLISTFKEIIMN